MTGAILSLRNRAPTVQSGAAWQHGRGRERTRDPWRILGRLARWILCRSRRRASARAEAPRTRCPIAGPRPGGFRRWYGLRALSTARRRHRAAGIPREPGILRCPARHRAPCRAGVHLWLSGCLSPMRSGTRERAVPVRHAVGAPLLRRRWPWPRAAPRASPGQGRRVLRAPDGLLPGPSRRGLSQHALPDDANPQVVPNGKLPVPAPGRRGMERG